MNGLLHVKHGKMPLIKWRQQLLRVALKLFLLGAEDWDFLWHSVLRRQVRLSLFSVAQFKFYSESKVSAGGITL